ncbi:DUF2254 domain-containing protein [Bizionia gelidisalsuginis]|uniref:DUF2254 domain-containing protein n=1 Tax=Bizionia gelidisalsuginis TaxID=291188 RepID=A0ABY3MEH8_9FLAO|nr:DUF2254 domain-containing protein [Bizionia gelidisalsuginis]TYC17955.1 DUF2254 domain-containing protein [Bizionia gelidisalsuginis]
MKEKFLFILRSIFKLKDKIAFFPTLIAFAGSAFAYLMFYLESQGISKYLLDIVPDLVINNTDTARTLLTTITAGSISIMVFSFSMVMVLLNQASSNFSPRLLPGLISNRRHQVILGIYVATILYCIFTLISIRPSGNEYQLPGFSVLLAIVFMVVSLGAFIYFIHSISQSIQINNIMDKIFKKSSNRLLHLIDSEKDNKESFKSSDNWNSYKSYKTGYLQNISLENIAEIAKKHECKIEISANKGAFLLEKDILFKTEIELDEETLGGLHTNFDFAKSELIEDNYVLAFKQLTEIAVKAMSPGINDPGTALNAIDYLSQLYVLRLKKNDISFTYIDDIPWVFISTVNFSSLLYEAMASLRTYCKHDVILVKRLLTMLNNLKRLSTVETYTKSITEEIENLKTDASHSIKNERDLALIASENFNV